MAALYRVGAVVVGYVVATLTHRHDGITWGVDPLAVIGGALVVAALWKFVSELSSN